MREYLRVAQSQMCLGSTERGDSSKEKKERNVIFIPVYKMKPKVSLSPPSSRNIDLRMSRLAGLDLVREPSDRSQAEA